MRYVILTDTDPDSLQEEIQEYAEEGWVVQGGLQTATEIFDDGSSSVHYSVLMAFSKNRKVSS